MTEDQKFYKALQDILGGQIEGQGGLVNWMRIKTNYHFLKFL